MKTKLILTLTTSLLGSTAFAGDIECADVSHVKTSTASQWYQVGRTLTSKGFHQIGFRALERVVLSTETVAAKSFAAPAMECMAKIQQERPDLSLPEPKSLSSLPRTPGVIQYTFRLFLQKAVSAKPSQLLGLLKILKGSSLHYTAAQGYLATLKGDFARAKTLLTEAINGMNEAGKSLPAELKAIRPELQLGLARSLYAEKDHAQAISEYKRLFRIGRPMQNALMESGWSHLRAGDHAKAIGLSFELQTGKMNRFFAPEANSIQAIAFLENCRYSEAKRSIEHFSSAYAPVVEWLSHDQGQSLYETAIARAEGVIAEDSIPDRVWSVWAGSEVFHALQAGVRASFKEEREARDYLTAEATEPKMRAILESEIKALAAYRSDAAAKIESHLERLNSSMLARIGREAERLRFVRIETNQGAARDLVYLNAHPEVLRLEKSLKNAMKPKRQRTKLYWGKARVNDPKAELWIDEIGGFEGSSLNRCERPKLQAKSS